MSEENLPPVIPCEQCSGDCWASDSMTDEPGAVWAGPCWGQVDVIDEEYNDEGDWWWIHGCEGHRDRWAAYVAPPPSPIRSTEQKEKP